MSVSELAEVRRPDERDRARGPVSPWTLVRRRYDGHFEVDPFGADSQLMDLLAWGISLGVRAEVEHAERLPRTGGALIVANRGFGVVEPAALAVGVRAVTGRRIRVIGAPTVPVVGDLLRKFGALGTEPGDVAALLRSGGMAAAPLAMTWLRNGAGAPPRDLLAAILGFPVIPVAVVPGGPAGLPIRPWRVIVGPMVETETDEVPGDTLAAAELAERTRTAVRKLLTDA
jgi:hypothetical protein